VTNRHTWVGCAAGALDFWVDLVDLVDLAAGLADLGALTGWAGLAGAIFSSK
jgi:hypothetical protein